MIGNVTEPEKITMQICAEHNEGVCACAKTWGFPRDGIRACRELLEKVTAGIDTVKADEAGRRA